MPELIDIINVGENNLLMGGLIEAMKLSVRNYSFEVKMGFSIILLGTFLTMYVIHMKKNLIMTEPHSGIKETMIRAVFISICVGVLLIIRLSANGVSLWWFVYQFVPVVRSMRAVARFFLWLSFPMSIITAYAADRYLKSQKSGNLLLSVFALLMIFVSNIDRQGVFSKWDCFQESRFMYNVPVPPDDAEILYIIDTLGTEYSCTDYQVDAFEIADRLGLKTINGYSGQFPEGWLRLWDIQTDFYEPEVFDWIEKYHLEHVYAYDRGTNTWISVKDRYKVYMDPVSGSGK
ncbi:MAG: hypothetical protein IKP86_07005, partial [Anaerolineaceae bacterium]|nr:hypothetical protein [Anaerolineaceae bacterium]